jgi:hypothetical protein
MEANSPSAAMFVICALGVSAVPEVVATITPLRPNSHEYSVAFANSDKETYREKLENMPVMLQQDLRQQ